MSAYTVSQMYRALIYFLLVPFFLLSINLMKKMKKQDRWHHFEQGEPERSLGVSADGIQVVGTYPSNTAETVSGFDRFSWTSWGGVAERL